MGLARQLRQHLRGIGPVVGFAQNHPLQGHGGVGTHDRPRRQTTLGVALHGRFELQAGDALYVIHGRFAWQSQLQGFGIFLRPGQEQRMGHANLREQLAAPWALGGEVNQRMHSSCR